jgi:photosystem II stability/assembly factor-like uncharacterized protein
MRKIVFVFVCVVVLQNTVIQAQDEGWVLEDIGVTVDLTDVYFLNDSTGWIVGGGNPCLIKKTINGGDTWTDQYSGVGNVDLKSIFFIDENHGWIAGEHSTLLRTVNGGDTWTKILMPDDRFYFGVQFVSQSHGWIVADSSSYILESFDGGETWAQVTNAQMDSTGFRGIHFVTDSVGYLCGRAGKILRTVDSGNTWEAKNYSSPKALSGISFVNPEKGWAVGSQGLIIYTTDGGSNWTVQASGVTITFKSVFFVNESLGFATGQEGIIIQTTNGGNNWNVVESGNQVDLKSVFFIHQDEGWVTGEDGIFLHYDANTLGLIEKNYKTEELTVELNPHPAEANSSLMISAEKAGEMQYHIYEVNGKLLFSSPTIRLNAGNNSIELPSQVKTGLRTDYLLFVFITEHITTTRLFLIK